MSTSKWAWTSTVGFSYFLIALVSLHILRQDYNPLVRFMSEYAVGPYGWLMISAFFGLGLGSLALLYALYLTLKRSKRSHVALGFFGLWAIGVCLAGLFITDLQTESKTPTGLIHDIAALIAFLSFPVASILLSLEFRQNPLWKPFSTTAFILTSLVILGLIVYFSSFTTGLIGLNQRVYVALILCWLMTCSLRLHFVTNHDP